MVVSVLVVVMIVPAPFYVVIVPAPFYVVGVAPNAVLINCCNASFAILCNTVHTLVASPMFRFTNFYIVLIVKLNVAMGVVSNAARSGHLVANSVNKLSSVPAVVVPRTCKGI